MRKLLLLLTTWSALSAGMPARDEIRQSFDSDSNNVIVHKQFYLHSGPETPPEKKVIFGKASRKFKVVLVNIPSAYEKARQSGWKPFQVSYAPTEEKLALYVLSPQKNREELEVVNIQPTTPSYASPPEVHFIKYKDEEEIQDVRTKITDHYLALDSQ